MDKNNSQKTSPESTDNDDTLCIDCSVLSNPDERKDCEDLTHQMAQGNIDLETFSNALLDKVSEDDEKFLSVFCDPDKGEEQIKSVKDRT